MTQFNEAVPLLSGYTWLVNHHADGTYTYGAPYSIVDRVWIPANISPGQYLLSWRWDAEGTAQVWENCADVTIT